MFYVLINCNGIKVRESEKMLSLEEMQNLVGVEGKEAWIEVASYRSFSDKSITMICDDEFRIKKIPANVQDSRRGCNSRSSFDCRN